MSARRKTKAVVVDQGGVVKFSDIDLPPLGPHDALVRLAAAPIHPADLNSIEGKYPGTPAMPFVGGREGAGFVEEIGAEVTTVEPGDLVLLPGEPGTWREETIVHALDLFPVPHAVPAAQAALLRMNPGTALRLLRDFIPLLPGEWVVQNAANSAVGRAVCQLARHLGWRTLNLVRDPDSLDTDLRAAGHVFLRDDASADLHAVVDRPIRLGLNAVGGESALRLANALADSGTLVTYGAMARQPLRLPNSLLIFRDLHVRGFWLTRWSGHASPSAMQAMLAELVGLAVGGILHSWIDTVYPLEACADALAHAARPQRKGKIMFGNDQLLRRNE